MGRISSGLWKGCMRARSSLCVQETLNLICRPRPSGRGTSSGLRPSVAKQPLLQEMLNVICCKATFSEHKCNKLRSTLYVNKFFLRSQPNRFVSRCRGQAWDQIWDRPGIRFWHVPIYHYLSYSIDLQKPFQ